MLDCPVYFRNDAGIRLYENLDDEQRLAAELRRDAFPVVQSVTAW